MISYARRQPSFQHRRAQYGQASPMAPRPSGVVSNGYQEQYDSHNYTQQPASTWTAAETTAVANTVSSLIGQGATVITGIINGNNERDREQLRAATAIRLAEINAQAAAATEPELRARLADQAAALAAINNAIAANHQVAVPPPGLNLSRNTIIAGVAALVIAGSVALIVTRKNPTESRSNSDDYVNAKQLEEIRRRLGKRHAA